MANLATVERSGALAQWNDQQIELIKTQIAPKCSDAELALFGQVCQRTGLDPFARQIYAIKRGQGETEKMSIQTSIDGYRLIADRTNKYGGSETLWCGQDGQWVDVWLANDPPAAAKTLIYKVGSDKPFVGVARFDSYKQEYWDKTEKRYKLSSLWAKMPDLMIGKCSEALALRKAFPAELSGLYTREEMMQADIQPTTVEVQSSDTMRVDLMDEVMGLVKTLGWTKREASQFLQQHFGKATREELTTNELASVVAMLSEMAHQADQEPMEPILASEILTS